MEKAITIIMLIFALIGLSDRIFGNYLGIGKEFEKGFELMGSLILTMVGMIVLAPFLAEISSPAFNYIYSKLGLDPSIITSSVLASDMGGAQLAKAVAKDAGIGKFNGLVVGTMMGATISFTIPFALGVLKKDVQKQFILGLLCGIITIPVGTVFGMIISRIPFKLAVINLIPLVIFSLLLAGCLLKFPNASIKVFRLFGMFIKAVITVGLGIGMIKFLTGFEVIKNTESFEYGVEICLKCAVAMAGAFPMLYILSKILDKPLKRLGEKLNLNEKSMLGFISTLASNITTIGIMDKMDQKGVVLNSAFAVSAAFVIADHLAFTMAFDGSYVLIVVASKLVSGIAALLFASFVYKKVGNKILPEEKNNEE